MHVTCQNLVINCVDFRIQKSICDWLEKRDLTGDYDHLCTAGGIQDLVRPCVLTTEALFKEITLSCNLHQVKRIILINHENCGAYGDALEAGSAKEQETHHADLSQAKALINEHWPQIEVETWFYQLNGEFIQLN